MCYKEHAFTVCTKTSGIGENMLTIRDTARARKKAKRKKRRKTHWLTYPIQES